MVLEKKDFLAALEDYHGEPSILPDELWWLYQSALKHAGVREKSAYPLADLMVTSVVAVHPDDLLQNIAPLMLEKRVSGFPVVENDVLVGIVTEGDLMAVVGVPVRIAQKSWRKKVLNTWKRPFAPTAGSANKVRDVMTHAVITAQPQDSLQHGLKLMGQHQITRLIIVNDKQHVIGIVTRADILRFTSAAPHTKPPLPPGNAG